MTLRRIGLGFAFSVSQDGDASNGDFSFFAAAECIGESLCYGLIHGTSDACGVGQGAFPNGPLAPALRTWDISGKPSLEAALVWARGVALKLAVHQSDACGATFVVPSVFISTWNSALSKPTSTN